MAQSSVRPPGVSEAEFKEALLVEPGVSFFDLTHTDLFILDTLARDQGLKVRRRDSVGGARLVSWVLI